MLFQGHLVDGFYHRTINIHISEEQLQRFTKLTKPSEIDDLISEILSQSKFGTMQALREFTADVWLTWKRRLTFDFDWPDISMETPRITVDNVVKLIVFAGILFVCRRYNISVFYVFASGALYFLYLHLDFECRKVSSCRCI